MPPPHLMNNRYKSKDVTITKYAKGTEQLCTQPEVFTLRCHVIFVVLLVLKFYLIRYFFTYGSSFKFSHLNR